MRVKFNPNITTMSNRTRNSAISGAMIGAGLYTAANTISYISNPKQLDSAIKVYGGKMNYAKNFLIGLSMMSAFGALINTAISILSRKVTSKIPPKAVN